MANITKTGIVTSTGCPNENLLSRYTAAGGTQTQNYKNYGITILATESKDTYFTLYLKEQLTQNEVYTISCQVEGLLDGTYYNFPLFAQNNSSMGMLKINTNGMCCMTFTMTYSTQTAATVNGETVYKCLMDDINRNIVSGQGHITLTNFKIEKGSIPTPWVPANTDPIFVTNSYNMFEVSDICKIHKNGNIQASEFIEW